MPRLTISLSAIADNYRRLACAAPGATCAAVVKTDAYGLGLEPVTRTLLDAGCEHFFVANAQEGGTLRKICPGANIYVLTGTRGADPASLQALRLVPVINSADDLAAWHAAVTAGSPYAVQIDSGMSRLGLDHSAVTQFADALQADAIPAPCLIMSHLACAEDPDHPANITQLQRCRALRELFPDIPFSLANSSGVFLGEDYHFDLVRPGAALYGINPTPHLPSPVRAVISWQAQVLQLRGVASGEFIGYGATFRASRASRIAIVDAGYASGFPRSASNSAHVLVAGHPAAIVGRVSMDLLAIDVTDLPDPPRSGDTVELIGPSYDVDDLARDAATIGYELLTRIGPVNERYYLS